MKQNCIYSRVVVIEFCHGFIDYNYLSLNRQLILITITKAAYMTVTITITEERKMTKLQSTMLNYRLK